jgi:hypothetical protein
VQADIRWRTQFASPVVRPRTTFSDSPNGEQGARPAKAPDAPRQIGFVFRGPTTKQFSHNILCQRHLASLWPSGNWVCFDTHDKSRGSGFRSAFLALYRGLARLNSTFVVGVLFCAMPSVSLPLCGPRHTWSSPPCPAVYATYRYAGGSPARELPARRAGIGFFLHSCPRARHRKGPNHKSLSPARHCEEHGDEAISTVGVERALCRLRQAPPDARSAAYSSQFSIHLQQPHI